MSQASPEFQRLLHHISDVVHPVLHSKFSRQLTHTLENAKGWLLGLIVLLLLLLWNWQLVASGSVGMISMVLVYLVMQKQLSLPQIEWQVLWSSANRSLTLSIVSGSLVWFSLYLILCIWQEAGGSWLAKGLILQGLGTLAILLLLVWQRVVAAMGDRATGSTSSTDQWLAELADPDPLKRLIAIRCLTRYVQASSAVSPPIPLHSASAALLISAADLADCFRLMLNRETEPIVCRALVDGLKVLNSDRQLSPSLSQPLSPSLSQPSVTSVRQQLKLD